jgi:DNA-binding transcriptional LysR family regulator
VELYQLRSFVEVAELGHLTRAAERLHISQPALSAQIKGLEEEFEVDLFERSSSGMALTSAGKRLLGEAKKLLSAAQALRNEARAIKGTVAGVARVGTVSDPEFIRVGALMSAAVERYPLVEIQFHHEVSGAAFEKVRDGALDASFYYGGFAHPDVVALELREITYRIVAPAAWNDRIAGATWTDIAREPWIMTPPISTHSQLAAALFLQHNIAPTKVVEADDEVVVSSLVLAGLGMALMREDLALEKAGAREICLWTDVQLTTSLQFVYRRDRERDPILLALVDTLDDVWKLGVAAETRTGRPPRRSQRAASLT